MLVLVTKMLCSSHMQDATIDAIVTNEGKPLDGGTGGCRCQCMTPEGAKKHFRALISFIWDDLSMF